MYKKALYNLLRLNWHEDPSLCVDAWQVEDYRQLSLSDLFIRLTSHGITLDKESLLLYIDQAKDPEDLADCFADVITDPFQLDEIYLLLFELWRRFVPDKYSLSIFCDELDYRIEIYDSGLTETATSIEEVFEGLASLLDQNVESGADSREVFYAVCERCATDIEGFLYDFASDQVEQENIDYASKLVDRFMPYVMQTEWLSFLKIRLAILTDAGDVDELTYDLFSDFSESWDIEFSFEVLDFIIQTEQQTYFLPLLKHLLLLAEVEQDFRDLLFELRDYLEEGDLPDQCEVIKEVIDRRHDTPIEALVERDDPDLQQVVDLVVQLAIE